MHLRRTLRKDIENLLKRFLTIEFPSDPHVVYKITALGRHSSNSANSLTYCFLEPAVPEEG